MSTALMERPTEQLPQHLQALKNANAIRLGRANLHRMVERGEVTVAHALDHRFAQSEKVARVLGWQFRWGQVRARKFLARLGITETKKVQTLTDRQKALILDVLAADRARSRSTPST